MPIYDLKLSKPWISDYEIHTRTQTKTKSIKRLVSNGASYLQTTNNGGLMNVKKLITQAVIACGVIGAEALFTFILNRKKSA